MEEQKVSLQEQEKLLLTFSNYIYNLIKKVEGFRPYNKYTNKYSLTKFYAKHIQGKKEYRNLHSIKIKFVFRRDVFRFDEYVLFIEEIEEKIEDLKSTIISFEKYDTTTNDLLLLTIEIPNFYNMLIENENIFKTLSGVSKFNL